MDSHISEFSIIHYEDMLQDVEMRLEPYEQWNENFDLYEAEIKKEIENSKGEGEFTECTVEEELKKGCKEDAKDEHSLATLQSLPVLKNDLPNLVKVEKKTDDLSDFRISDEEGDTHVVILNMSNSDACASSSEKQEETSREDVTKHVIKSGDTEKKVPPSKVPVKSKNTPGRRLEPYHKMPYDCDICDKSFNQKTSLSYHKQLHAEKKNYTCKMCGKTLLLDMSKPNSLIHTCMFTCNICDKTFATNKLLLKHLSTHSKVYVCKSCKKSFITEDDFREHRPTCIPKIMCANCNKFFLQSHFFEHMATHSLKQCPVCKKLFSTCHVFRQHLQTHEKEH